MNYFQQKKNMERKHTILRCINRKQNTLVWIFFECFHEEMNNLKKKLVYLILSIFISSVNPVPINIRAVTNNTLVLWLTTYHKKEIWEFLPKFVFTLVENYPIMKLIRSGPWDVVLIRIFKQNIVYVCIKYQRKIFLSRSRYIYLEPLADHRWSLIVWM